MSFFLTIDTMQKVQKSCEGKFIKIPSSMNANLTAGNVNFSPLRYFTIFLLNEQISLEHGRDKNICGESLVADES